MGNENGVWIMHGMRENEKGCIRCVEDLVSFINEVGFLPLFKNDIDGFSVEEHAQVEYWWSGNEEKDPWEWRKIIAQQGDVAYGKFFGKKAGFISKDWLPIFANYRRNGYDFDALCDDGKASNRQRKIMAVFEENAEAQSNELKMRAGFSRFGAEKNFEGTLASLQMMTYLCICDFRQRLNKKQELYGWPIAVYTPPERLFGYEFVTKLYDESPKESQAKILKRMKKLYPDASEKQLAKI